MCYLWLAKSEAALGDGVGVLARHKHRRGGVRGDGDVEGEFVAALLPRALNAAADAVVAYPVTECCKAGTKNVSTWLREMKTTTNESAAISRCEACRRLGDLPHRARRPATVSVATKQRRTVRRPESTFLSSFVLMGILVAEFAATSFGASYSVDSPDGKIQAVVEDGARLTFTLKADGKTLLDKHPIGLKTGKVKLGKEVSALSNEYSRANSQTRKAFDIRKAGIAKYNTISLDFKDFGLSVRVCDEAATCRFTMASNGKMIVEDEIFERPSRKDDGSTVAKVTVGEEHVIVRGIRPEEQLWGAYQFPCPYKLDDRIVVSVHVAVDNIKSFAANTKKWFESRDNGVTWKEVDPFVSAQCGLLL
ncbi:MAG: glycoside hydrolase family 97 N-terminal domain-containing protein [Verrucomicrobia bacterium]|nr:glycoside hydrolase family 97 N-terminal domain-containing protein [Verrucomicrobiota bacterium]